MASRKELDAALEREYERFKAEKPKFTYNTGYLGRHQQAAESVSRNDYDDAAAAFNVRVQSDFGPICSVRTAASFSGRSQGTWSILIEKAGVPQPLFNFHIIVS